MLKQYLCTMRYFIGEYLLIEPIKIKEKVIRCLKNVAIDTSHAKRIEEELGIEFVISVQGLQYLFRVCNPDPVSFNMQN